jgi:O-acetyl-ADP-ribose deacetylase (regulator of RNase III)
VRAEVAGAFRDRYPAMYAEYHRQCKAQPRQFNPGDAWLWKADGQPWVFNLGTQEGVWRARASYAAVEASLKNMRRQADREGVTSIAVPRVGAGYGGLSWRKVRAVIERALAGWPGTLYVYEGYAPEEGGSHGGLAK